MKLCKLMEKLTDEDISKVRPFKFFDNETNEAVCPLAKLGRKLGFKGFKDVSLRSFFEKKQGISRGQFMKFFYTFDMAADAYNGTLVKNKKAIAKACKEADKSEVN